MTKLAATVHPASGHFLAAAVAILFLCAGTAVGQATWPVEVLIPEALSVRAPEDAIQFDFSESYPPLEFLARYSRVTLPLQLHSSLEGVWTVSLEISDITDDSGTRLIPASQVYYRVNGGNWLQADGFAAVIHTQSGPTFGWFELSIEFAVELNGTEQAGDYRLETIFTAQSETF